MSEKLKDPSKAAHEIVEVLEDGGAIRNDGVQLTAANKNPWYVLATIHREQEEGATWLDYNEALAAKNRRAWNGWFCSGLNANERSDLAKKIGVDEAELAPLSKAELLKVTKLFGARMGKSANLPEQAQEIDFANIYFTNFTTFKKFTFLKNTCFQNAVFKGAVSFRRVYFSGSVNYKNTQFLGPASFRETLFNWRARFDWAQFCQEAVFVKSRFSGKANFKRALFKSAANFRKVTFKRDADFVCANFGNELNLRSSTFEATTLFTDAKFLTYVPEFHSANLYSDTEFTLPDDFRENWPPLAGENVMKSLAQKQAYNQLRLFMNRTLRVEEEQFFQRQEMRCKMVLSKWYHKPLYWFFEGASGFGGSVVRPVAWLFVVWLMGVIANLKPLAESGWPDYWSVPHAMGWSLANLLSFLGFQRRYFGGEDLNAVLMVVGGIQTICGVVLLFLLGLGVRNRFRLR